MLCNRPPDEPSRAGGGEVDHQPPFKSTISATQRDQLGLPPAKDGKKIEPISDVKTRGPSAALRRHCQWIKELQQQVREDRRRAESGERMEQERRDRMQEEFKRQREAIRRVKQSRDVGDIHPHEIEAIMRPKADRRKTQQDTHKPLWAMTEEEREGFEDEEADDLIRFAEGIDFDKYITDLEFRQGLEAMRDRAKKLQREQDAFKDSILREFNEDEEECESTTAGGDPNAEAGADRATSRRAASDDFPDNRPDWDASTACGEDRPAADRARQAAAEQVLQANPSLRGVHSKGSMQRLIERASEQGSVSGFSV